MGLINSTMRSGVHKAIFEFGGVNALSAAIGIARPMDYNNKTLYQNQGFFLPKR